MVEELPLKEVVDQPVDAVRIADVVPTVQARLHRLAEEQLASVDLTVRAILADAALLGRQRRLVVELGANVVQEHALVAPLVKPAKEGRYSVS